MNDQRNQILEMLSQGKVTVSEAERLLDAVSGPGSPESAAIEPPKSKPKYLRVVVEDGKDNVNIRVPLQLLRAGMQFASLVPDSVKGKIDLQLKKKGINFDLGSMKPEMVEDLIGAVGELEVSVDEKDGERVRIFCE